MVVGSMSSLTWKLVIDLSLLCSFQRMRSHLGVKESDPAKFPADKLVAVAEELRKSTFLRVSEDGAFSSLPSMPCFDGYCLTPKGLEV